MKNGVRPGRFTFEALEVGEKLLIDKVAEVVAGQGAVVVELAVIALGSGPGFPAAGFVENAGVLLSLQGGLISAVLFQPVEVFTEKQPGGLLSVFENTTTFSSENIIDILEGSFEHGFLF